MPPPTNLMTDLDAHYPTTCPFCTIATAYPPTTAASPVPSAADADPEKVSPAAFVLLSTPLVLAFLDILPITPGHVLLATRRHAPRLSTVSTAEACALGFWLPVLSRVLLRTFSPSSSSSSGDTAGAAAEHDLEDWNIVQNNGARAAQVVPHVHFHLIPRHKEGSRSSRGAAKEDVGLLRSWKMFGRGSRTELDEDEGAELAAEVRRNLEDELGRMGELGEWGGPRPRPAPAPRAPGPGPAGGGGGGLRSCECCAGWELACGSWFARESGRAVLSDPRAGVVVAG
ncbi:hypothetical protein LTR50_003596 [Elasticomyces elasticus]|nr:hypothetical protein LTR50_003596 [Elasticomyces elasticus]